MSKTFDVPDKIPLSKVRAFLADLGVPDRHLIVLTIGVEGVNAEFYAEDENGHPYLNPNGDPALDRIAIRLDRDA